MGLLDILDIATKLVNPIDYVKGANWLLGDTCPRCGHSSIVSQEDKGKTWFSGKRKVKCGKCGKVFTVDD